MKILMNPSKCTSQPPAKASGDVTVVEFLQEMGKVDLTLEWTPCEHCSSVHSRTESCNGFFIALSWLTPSVYSKRSGPTYFRLYQFTLLYLAFVLPLTYLMNLAYFICIYPDFAGSAAGANNTQLPMGYVESSFTFARDGEIFVGRMDLKSCGSENQTIQVDALQWNPPAVSFNSPVFVNMSTQVMDEIKAPVEVSVEVSRFVLFTWVSVPCIDGIGSCTYEDVCAFSPESVLPCPRLSDNFHIPCECPVKPGEYFIKNGEIQLPGTGTIPKWLTSGWYRASVKVRDPVHNVQLACYETKINIY